MVFKSVYIINHYCLKRAVARYRSDFSCKDNAVYFINQIFQRFFQKNYLDIKSSTAYLQNIPMLRATLQASAEFRTFSFANIFCR